MATTTNIRVKVKVADLLAAVRAARAAAAKVNEKAVADEARRFADWQKKAMRSVEQQDITKYDQTPNWSPVRVDKLNDFDRDIKLLGLCSDETMTLTASSSFVKYL